MYLYILVRTNMAILVGGVMIPDVAVELWTAPASSGLPLCGQNLNREVPKEVQV